METRRRLKKVGGSVMLSIPAEIAAELGLGPDSEVEVRSEGRSLRVEPVAERPPGDLVEFAHRFTRRYEEALRELADR